MKIYYDKEADAAYIELSKKKPDGVIELSDYINVDTSKDGEIIGIEFLNASKKISIDSLYNYEIEIASLLSKPIKHIKRTNKVLA